MRQQPSASTPPSGVTPSGGGTRSYANNRLHHSTAHTPVLPLHGAAPSSGGYSSSTTASPVQPTPTASPQSSVGPPLVSPPFASSSKAMMISGTPTLRTPTSSSTQPTSQQAPMRPLTRVLLQNTAASQQPAYHVDPHIGLQQPLSAPQRHRTPPPLLHNDPSKAFPLRSPPNLSHTASATSSNTTRSTPGGMMLQSPPLSSPPQVPNLQDSSALAQPPAVPPPNRATRKVTVTIREDAASGAQLQQQPVTSSLRRHGGGSGAPASASSSARPASGTWKNALNPTKRQSAPPSSSAAASAASQSTQPKSWCPPSYNLDDGSHVGMTGSGLLVGRFIIVTGGLRSVDNTPLNTVSCFDTRYGRWIPNVCNSGGGGKEGPSSAVPSPPLSQTAPQPWVLPEPLYGHCCVTHGQRSVWLVGGVSGSNLSRTIIRLTVDVHFASGTTQAATSHQSPAPFGAAGTTPPPEEIFNRGPPMSSASKAFASSHNNNATAGGNFGASSIQEDDSPTHFSVTNCRYYHLEFPVGFATCVKLHGALNPVALIMGGMSTVRDSDTGDIYPTTAVTSSGLVSTSSPATASTPSGHVSGSQATSAFGNNHASPNGAVLLPTAVPPPSDYAQRSQEARRLGITNRVFALNLDDCSMFRVAQLGDVPAPRMMGAAAPLLRRDVSGSYGSIVYYGGITAPQTGATGKTSGSTMGATTTANSSSTISTPFFSGKPKQPTKSSSTASVGGGNNGSKPVVDDSRFVFVASVLHDPKSKTFSLIWTHHKQRSKADPWPSAIAGHSLSPMPGFALLLGGCPTIPVQKTSGGDEEPDSPQTPLPCHRTLALLYDVSSGVAWTEVNPTSSVAPSSTSSSSCAAAFTMQDCNQLVYHRALVVEAPSGGDTTSSPPSSRPSTQGPTGSMSDAVGASLTSTVFVIGGGPSCPAGMTSSCSPARGRNTLMASFTIPHSLMQSTIPHSDSDEECQECTIHVQIEVSKHNSAGSTSTSSSSALFSKGSTATSAGGTATTTNTTNSSASHGVIDHEFTLERKHVCIDKLVQFIADKIITDNAAFRPFLSKAMILPLNPSLNQIDAVKRVIVNNLLLYSRSSDGERVPLSNDHVLDRMVRRAGLNAMPLVASLIPPIKGYRLLSKLGEGSFGKVYSAMNEDNGQFFAVKRVRFASDQREQLLREIRLLRCLDHPNIVKYLGVEVSEEKQMANIFLEYVKMEGCGDLTSLLRRLGSNPPLTIIRSHLRQVLAALVYLHSYHIVHQDIKGANVLVGVDVTKLADFGTARQLVPEDDQELSGVGDGGEDGNESEMGSVSEPASNTVSPRQQQQQSTASGVSPRRASLSSATRSNGGGPTIRNRREAREGTAVFMAPEVLIGGEHEEMTTSSDIWSVGCLLIEMTTGKLPWLSQLTGDRRDALIELRNRMMRQEKPSYPSRQDFPASGVRFLDDCLVYDPRMRKSAAQLYEHPFLTDDFDEDNSPEWSAEAPRCTSPLSGVSNLGTGFHLGGRQASDLICANSTLENCVETFEEFPPPSSTAARNENTNGQSAAPAPAVRRVVGLPSALRKK